VLVRIVPQIEGTPSRRRSLWRRFVDGQPLILPGARAWRPGYKPAVDGCVVPLGQAALCAPLVNPLTEAFRSG
jgi:hypothetical protein